MKIRLILLVGAVAAPGCAGAGVPDLSEARVTIPYPELKALWEAAQLGVRAKESPIPAAVLSARYSVSVAEGRLSGTAEFRTSCFREGWTPIPLMGSGARIAGVEPPDAKIVLENGRYALLAERPGPLDIKVRFAANFTQNGDVGRLQIEIPPAASSVVSVSDWPAGRAVRVCGAAELSSPDGTSMYAIPAGEPLVIELAALPSPPVPSAWKGEAAAFVRFTDNRLAYLCRMSVNAEFGSGLEMALKLPPAARVLAITGDDIASWRTDGCRVLLCWRTRDILSRSLDLEYEIPQPPGAEQWRLQAPQVEGDETAATLFAVAVDQGLELSAASPVAGRLPRHLEERAAQQAVVFADGRGLVNVRWLPVVATSPAVIDAAESTMRLVADGTLLNQICYRIAHDAPLSWRVDLPEGSELLSCAVNGARVTPASRGGGSIELALSAPGENKATEVVFSYTAHRPALDPVAGQLELDLPMTALLIHRINWTLQLPEGYRLAAIEGNVAASAGKPGVIALGKELCRGERPSARIFYEKPEVRSK